MVFPFVSDRSLIVGSRSSFPRSLESPTREMWLIVTLYATCLADCLNALNIIPGKACGLQTEVKTADRSLSASDIMRTFVNILCSAEQSSAYCHYSSFFGRHNQQWWIRANIQHFFQYCGAEKRGIMQHFRQKTPHFALRTSRALRQNIALVPSGNSVYDENNSWRPVLL